VVILHAGTIPSGPGWKPQPYTRRALDSTRKPSYGEGAMYAHAPQASASTPPLSPLSNQHQLAPQAQVHPHGHPHGMPPAAHGGPGVAVPGQARAAAAAAALGNATPSVARHQVPTAFAMGAFQSSGDPAIDRMIRLEASCKLYGSPI